METGPATLRELAVSRLAPTLPELLAALEAHASAWEAEREDREALAAQLVVERAAATRLAEQLAVVQQRLEVLEQDRKWWQENAIKRVKRAASRRGEGAPDGRRGT
jgi:hypothetical protein